MTKACGENLCPPDTTLSFSVINLEIPQDTDFIHIVTFIDLFTNSIEKFRDERSSTIWRSARWTTVLSSMPSGSWRPGVTP